MQNEYIRKLWSALENTEFYHGRTKLQGYDQGICFLLEIFLDIKAGKGRVFFIGNGGSAAVADHMTADYMKNGNMITCSLYNTAVMTCLSNDYNYEEVFSKQIELWAEEKDLLVAVSSSGNSPNILRAIEAARQKKCRVITFTGFKGDNKAKQMGDFNVYVPACAYGMVESIHNLILQQVVDQIKSQMR